jgi:hypothetical protein
VTEMINEVRRLLERPNYAHLASPTVRRTAFRYGSM